MDSITNSMYMSLSKPWEIVKDMEALHTTICGMPRVGQDAETNNNLKSVLKFSLRENQSVKKLMLLNCGVEEDS